jgi:hypothetical protein
MFNEIIFRSIAILISVQVHDQNQELSNPKLSLSISRSRFSKSSLSQAKLHLFHDNK